MFPSTEPIRTRPVEPFGEEKNGTSLRYDHRISPLSWDSRNTQMRQKIPPVNDTTDQLRCSLANSQG